MISSPAIRQYTETLQIANRAALAGEYAARHETRIPLRIQSETPCWRRSSPAFMDRFLFCTAVAHIAAHNDTVGR
jgi:hypothetical protein